MVSDTLPRPLEASLPRATWRWSAMATGSEATRCGNDYNFAVDLKECATKGLIGALGVIPGTVAAHPFDVIKIRMQTSKDSIPVAMATVSKTKGIKGFYGGIGSAIQQKTITWFG